MFSSELFSGKIPFQQTWKFLLAKAFNLVSAFYRFYENLTKEMNEDFLGEMFSLAIFDVCLSKCGFVISPKICTKRYILRVRSF